MFRWPIACGWLLVAVCLLAPLTTRADNVVEMPVLSMIDTNDRGAFRVMLMSWDKRPAPNPIELQWGNQRVRVLETGMNAVHAAFRYAIDHSPSIASTGTITLYSASYVPTHADGPSSGAAMAVGFLAVLRGAHIIRGVALTGTIEPDGRIGPVGGIPDKVRAAKREGYHLVLVPSEQMRAAQWNLHELALELNLTIKEVGTIEEAYVHMTGGRP